MKEKSKEKQNDKPVNHTCSVCSNTKGTWCVPRKMNILKYVKECPDDICFLFKSKK
jgi:hypothetical protein